MQAARGASLSRDASTARGGRRLVGVLLCVAGLVLLVDQATKALAEARLADGRVVEVVDGLLRLRLVYNPGAAFSLATNATVLLSVVSVAVVVVILRISRKLAHPAWAVALGALLGGALGNLVDRLFRSPGPLRGEVVDFLELPSFPVFNVADSAIVVGASLMVLLSMLGTAYDAAPGSRRASTDPQAEPGE
jgi:signal peptidase II